MEKRDWSLLFSSFLCVDFSTFSAGLFLCKSHFCQGEGPEEEEVPAKA